MEIDIAQERFVAHGLVILARNYLDVYPYDHWSDKVIKRRPGQRSEFTSPVGLQREGKAVVFPALVWSTGAGPCSLKWQLSFASVP